MPQLGQHAHFIAKLFHLATGSVLELFDRHGLPRPEAAEHHACIMDGCVCVSVWVCKCVCVSEMWLGRTMCPSSQGAAQ